jgi:hypothetical protein
MEKAMAKKRKKAAKKKTTKKKAKRRRKTGLRAPLTKKKNGWPGG